MQEVSQRPITAEQETPPDNVGGERNVPVGHIEFLGSNGNVGETVEYTDADRFVKDMC